MRTPAGVEAGPAPGVEEGDPFRQRGVLERLEDAAAVVRTRSALRPRVALGLGTGLGALADEIDIAASMPWEDVPGFARSAAGPEEGRLVLGTLAGTPVAVLDGRLHRYEGHSLQDVVFPVRLLRWLGADVLVLAGACGELRTDGSEGDLVILEDHINLLGDNPLIGPNVDALGPRFPDMSEPYDAELRAWAEEAARDLGVPTRRGVYAAVAGPSLATPAEYRMLRLLGADVVGMSIVPEVIAARHMAMRVLGVGIVTDPCDPDRLRPADTGRILRNAAPHVTRIVTRVAERLRTD